MSVRSAQKWNITSSPRRSSARTVASDVRRILAAVAVVISIQQAAVSV